MEERRNTAAVSSVFGPFGGAHLVKPEMLLKAVDDDASRLVSLEVWEAPAPQLSDHLEGAITPIHSTKSKL